MIVDGTKRHSASGIQQGHPVHALRIIPVAIQPAERFSNGWTAHRQRLATAANGRRESSGLVRDQQQIRVGTGFFQGLEQRVCSRNGHRIGRLQNEHLGLSRQAGQGKSLRSLPDLLDSQGVALRFGKHPVEVGMVVRGLMTLNHGGGSLFGLQRRYLALQILQQTARRDQRKVDLSHAPWPGKQPAMAQATGATCGLELQQGRLQPWANPVAEGFVGRSSH